MNSIIKINNSKFPHNGSIEQYNKIIDELKNTTSKLDPKSTVYLCFEEDVIFINPSFLILFLNFYEELKLNEIKILIDITNLANESQHAFLIHLVQYIDYKIIKIEHRVNPFSKKPDITNLNNPKYINLSSYHQIYVYYATETIHNQTQLKLDNDYKHLPIVKLTNNESYDEEYDNDNYGNRKNFYDKLQFEKEEKKLWLPLNSQEEYEKKNQLGNIWNIIFDKYLKINGHNNDTLEALKNILYETVYNIRKHTFQKDSIANGYISFFKTRKGLDNIFEFLIYDDYKDGFLEKYLETMIDEREKEDDPEAIEEYDLIINDLNENKDEVVLKNIFNLEYIFSVQKKRIIKHFGIPLLLKILVEINQIENKQKAQLTIYIHRNNQTYCITYLDGKTNVYTLHDTFIHGTFIHISIPQYSQIKSNIFEKKLLNVHTSYYKDRFKNRNIIDERNKNFKITNLKELKDKTIEYDINNQVSLILKYEKKDNISDFLRVIYSTAYLYESFIKDIVIFNFSIKANINYLEIYRDTASLKHISNILFLDYTHPRAIFIGGKEEDQMCLVNNILSSTYNYEKINFIKNNCDELGEKKIEINSNLFYQYEEKDYFIPLDIFHKLDDKNNQYIYTNMIDNNLEEKYLKPYHVDIGGGFHIEKFYLLKQIFEDSTWISRIAFDLALKLNENSILIGVDTYSTLIINKALDIFDNDIESFIIYDFDTTNHFDKFMEGKNDEDIVLFCPVVANTKNIEKFLNNLSASKKYCAIKLEYSLNKEDNSFIPFFTKNIDHIIKDADNCSKCFAELDPQFDDNPLYTFDSDGFTIKNIFSDDVENDNTIFTDLAKDFTWKNSIYFGHVKRSTNHYLYYTKSLIFIKENKIDIKKVFKEIKLNHEENQIPIIFAPLDHTNNDFISIIDECVFKNNAIIHYFNLANKEQNYKIVDTLKNKYKNNQQYKFYFVDDEISSGNTLEYFFTLLNNITSIDIKFSAVFTMINRIDKFSSLILKNYFYDENFFIYKNLNIKPIKTNFESCYLCERKQELNKLSITSSLLFIKGQFKNKVKDLSVNISTDIEMIADNQELVEFKNYLKVSAVEFIYSNIESFDKIDENNYTEIESYLKDYKKIIKKDFYKMYLYSGINDKKLDDAISNILDFEADIAFIKALYFPKISYYHRIRNLSHKYIYSKLKQKRNEYFNIITKEIFIDPILKIDDLNAIKYYSELNDFYIYYTKDTKLNIDKFNFLIVASSYMNMNYILEQEMIEFYFSLTKKVKKDNLNIKLLHKYPVAIKALISYSISKAKYFQHQFDCFQEQEDIYENKLYFLKYEKDYSLIFSLYIENSLLVENHLEIEHLITDDFNKSINQLKSSIINYLTELNVDRSTIRFYVDSNPLETEEALIDIFNEYSSLNMEKENDEFILYKGAVSDNSNGTKDIKLKLNDKAENINNLWCNYYDEVNSRTLIRITETIDQTLEFNPVGVIVINHEKSLMTHLDLSRKLLKVQNQISDYLKINILPGIIADKENKVLGNYLRKYNHNVGDMIDLQEVLNQKLIDNTIFENFNQETYTKNELESVYNNINDFIIYTSGLPYIAKAAQLGFKKNQATHSNEYDFFDRVKRLKIKIIRFLEIAPTVSSKTKLENKNIKYSIDIKENSEKTVLSNVLAEDLDGIIFEFCYNAAKYNNLDEHNTCKIEFYTEDEYIIIENNLNKKDVLSNSKVGLLSIEKYFNTIGYCMNYEKYESKFIIKIKKEE